MKPKKALKGLFTRTEPAAVEEPIVVVEAKPAKKESPEPQTPSSDLLEVELETLMAQAELAPEATPALETLQAFSPLALDLPEESPAAEQEPDSEEPLPFDFDTSVDQQSPHVPEQMSAPEQMPLLVPEYVPAPEPMPEPQYEPAPNLHRMGAETADAGAQLAFAVMNIQTNFARSLDERMTWGQEQYLAFIRRIDAVQTEAFLLKGKLLEEVKRKFFEDNKTGWKKFCDESLDMNYTTANQYIRVSAEFDVTSHQRPDFGFEHFKAMLPLAPEARAELLLSLPQVSVKALRKIVQDRLMPEALPHASASTLVDSKAMVRVLQDLKMQIFECAPAALSQAQRWQLSAACRNLSDELAHLSQALFVEPMLTNRPRYEMQSNKSTLHSPGALGAQAELAPTQQNSAAHSPRKVIAGASVEALGMTDLSDE